MSNRAKRGTSFTPEMPRQNSKAVMQFWAQAEVPPQISKNLKAWSTLFGKRHRLFDDRSARDFLLKEFGVAEAHTFAAAKHAAIRSDYFRLGYLARCGGVYVDADTQPRRNTKIIIDNLSDAGVLCFETSRARCHIQNAFIAAPARSHFIEAAFEEATKRINDNTQPVQALAGGYMLTDVATLPHTQLAHGFSSMTSYFLRHKLMRPVGGGYGKTELNWRNWDAAIGH